MKCDLKALFFRANFRQQFQCLEEIQSVVDVKLMALTATCMSANCHNIITVFQ